MSKRAKSSIGRKYLYRPPPATHRMLMFAPEFSRNDNTLPDSVDLRQFMLPPRDQGREGSCSGFATAALREALHAVAAGTPLDEPLSPAYLYGRTRIAEGSFPADSGCSIVDEMATLQGFGSCPESYLPYTGSPSESPTPECDVAAQPFRVGTPLNVNTSNALSVRAVLAARMPVVIGIRVYQSFESTGGDGSVPPLAPADGLIGGHALLLCGYDVGGRWIVRNSWGTGWGSGGYCYFPPDYLNAVTMEAWTARPVA